MNQAVVYTPSGGLVLRESPPKILQKIAQILDPGTFSQPTRILHPVWGGCVSFFSSIERSPAPLRCGFFPERLESQAPWSTACTSRMARMARMARGRWLVCCGGWMTWGRTNSQQKWWCFLDLFRSGLFIFWSFFCYRFWGRVEKMQKNR